MSVCDDINKLIQRLRAAYFEEMVSSDVRDAANALMVCSLYDVRDAANALEGLVAECARLKAEVERLRGEQRLKSLIGPSENAVERIITERDHLRVALARTAASLAAVISLLETDGKAAKKAKKAAPSDKMFEQMLADYNHALGDARKALEGKE